MAPTRAIGPAPDNDLRQIAPCEAPFFPRVEGETRKGESDAEPAEYVAELIIQGNARFSIFDAQGNVGGFKTGAIDAARRVKKNVMNATCVVHPAGQAVVGAADKRSAVFDGAKNCGGCVLPLRSTFAKPTVVRNVNEDVGFFRHVFAHEMRKGIFKTNQNGGGDVGVVEVKWNGFFAGAERIFAGGT